MASFRQRRLGNPEALLKVTEAWGCRDIPRPRILRVCRNRLAGAASLLRALLRTLRADARVSCGPPEGNGGCHSVRKVQRANRRKRQTASVHGHDVSNGPDILDRPRLAASLVTVNRDGGYICGFRLHRALRPAAPAKGPRPTPLEIQPATCGIRSTRPPHLAPGPRPPPLSDALQVRATSSGSFHCQRFETLRFR